MGSRHFLTPFGKPITLHFTGSTPVPEREVIFEADVTLADGRPAREFIVRIEGQDGYTLFTTLGENYLVVNGTGDIEAIRQVTWSLR